MTRSETEELHLSRGAFLSCGMLRIHVAQRNANSSQRSSFIAFGGRIKIEVERELKVWVTAKASANFSCNASFSLLLTQFLCRKLADC
ncbi:hypothetical protein ACP6PL_30835 [Dapis sp. BLCC M126]|uniref:hypothetical protein n=1 Tax=Dapis sp. BLCC M126 TaxID=3400189 RepID=UPI003CF43B86